MLENWLSTENLLGVIVLLMANMNRQNGTIKQLLKPLVAFVEKYNDKIDNFDKCNLKKD